MAKEITVGSTRRFGPRYGRKVKYGFGVIEAEQRKLHKCPYCNAVKVKRIAVGIWGCRKCGAKFTGKAYSIKKKITFKEEVETKKEENQKAISGEVKTQSLLNEKKEVKDQDGRM